MSQSGRVGNHAAMEIARQKLDDLDTLIQRMLDLPVVDSDGDVLPRETTVQAEKKSALPLLASTMLTVVEPAREESAESWNDIRRITVVAPLKEKEEPYPAEPRRPHEEPVRTSSWLLPLVGLNRLFDFFTLLFGPMGRWLRSDRGRRLLGWVGVAFVVAALFAALLDGMGWLPR